MPGQEFWKWCAPVTRTTAPASSRASGPASARLPRASAATAHQSAGSTPTSTSSARPPAVTVMTTVAGVVAAPRGPAHCQPIASWASMASPTTRNAVIAQPRVARLTWIWVAGSSGCLVRPMLVSRASRPLPTTLAVRRQCRGRSVRSSSSSSVNSSPYLARQLAG